MEPSEEWKGLIQSNAIEEIKKKLQQQQEKTKINQNDILWYSATQGKDELIKYFIEKESFDFRIPDESRNNETILHWSIQKCSLETVKFLISNGCSILQKNEEIDFSELEYCEITTPLFYACNFERMEIVQFLIENGAKEEIDEVNMWGTETAGYNPIQIATLRGNLKLLKYLISVGANINFCEHAGNPLHIAAEQNNFEIVKYMILIGTDIDILNDSEQTPSMIATKHGNLELLKYFVSMGCEIFVKDSNGRGLLHFACGTNLEIVQYLVSIGCDFNSQTTAHETPIFTAAAAGKIEIVQFLITIGSILHSNGESLLNVSCSNFEMFKYLVSIGCSAEQTVLFDAIYEANIDILKYMVSIGCPCGIRENDGNTALIVGCLQKNLELIQFLIHNGCRDQLNDVNEQSLSPLNVASSKGDLAVVKYLVSLGAKVKSAYHSSIYFAAEYGNLGVVRFLFEETDIDKEKERTFVAENGSTPVLLSSSNGNLELVKYLVANGFDFNSQETNGLNAVWCAAARGHLEVVKFLVSVGADFEQKSNKGVSSWKIATKNKHEGVATYLRSLMAESVERMKKELLETKQALRTTKMELDLLKDERTLKRKNENQQNEEKEDKDVKQQKLN